MTQEEKAIKYDEALERAKQFSEHPLLEDSGAIVEYIFPELAESDDELTWLTKYIEEEAYSLSIDIRDDEDRIKLKKLQKALAWLEKQGEQKSVRSEEDEEALEIAIIALEDMYSEDSPLDCYAGHHMPFDKAASQLKSLKEKIGG